MKKESRILDGTPNKKLFWSIITDYSLNTSICELVDNAIDVWLLNKKQKHLKINIDIDLQNKTINISDNAGGVKESELSFLISPGASSNNEDKNIIGMFGVGSKRAVVALAKNVKIKTRHRKGNSYQIDIDDDWLANDSWDIPIYEIPNIPENSTIIELSSLRFDLNEKIKEDLSQHLSETYSQFLKDKNFSILFNSKKLSPLCFDIWAYPPNYEPRYYMFEIPTEDGEKVGVELYAGLIVDRDPVNENYGVYFYCNDRLIMKEVKSREVGYISKYAGVPHPDASLARVLVKIYGPARLMPWNSTKSSIHYGSAVFEGLTRLLFPVVTDFTSLSRRLKGDWDSKVFRYTKGEMQYLDIENIDAVRKSYLPPLPKVRKSAVDKLKDKNKKIVQDKPWVAGLLDSLAIETIIRRQKIETKNRIALIILDSTFEIALKEFIVHTEGLNKKGKSLEELFKQRDQVISVVQQKVTFKPQTLKRIKHYYQMRCKLIHERQLLMSQTAILIISEKRLKTVLRPSLESDKLVKCTTKSSSVP